MTARHEREPVTVARQGERLKTLTRPSEKATRDERVSFVTELRETLDELDIAPGEQFVITSSQGSLLYDVPDPDANALGPIGATDTSRKAALDNFPRSGSQRHRILVSLGSSSKTRYELCVTLEMPNQSVCPRIKELINGGWVRSTADTRVTATGSDAEVLEVTEKGAKELLERSL